MGGRMGTKVKQYGTIGRQICDSASNVDPDRRRVVTPVPHANRQRKRPVG